MRGAAVNRSLELTANPGITGLNTGGWYLKVFRGSPASWQVTQVQVPHGKYVLLAMPYPAGTTFSVVATELYAWPAAFDHPIPEAASLAEMLVSEATIGDPATFDCPTFEDPYRLCVGTGSPGPMWYFDSAAGVLYLRFVNLLYYTRDTRAQSNQFARNGLSRELISTQYVWKVDATCPPSSAFTEPGRTGVGFAPGTQVASVPFCRTGADTIPNPYGLDVPAEGACAAVIPDVFAYDDALWATTDPGGGASSLSVHGVVYYRQPGTLASRNMVQNAACATSTVPSE